MEDETQQSVSGTIVTETELVKVILTSGLLYTAKVIMNK